MSLFKTREFWYTRCEDEEQFDQNCLITSKLNTDSEFVITGGHSGVLRVFKPSTEINGNNNISAYKPTDLLLEKKLDNPILQVGVGRLVSGSHNLQIAILHPKYVSVCTLATKEGATDHGTQYVLQILYEHKLRRSSINFVIGPFGGSQNRDFICVQSLDGMLSFFEQETFTFISYLPDFLLPGPLVYVKKSDSFVTVTPNWHLESYSYKNLSERGVTSEEALTGALRVACNWSYNLGEHVIDVNNLVDNSTKESYIVVLGERNAFCFNESGKIRFMKKLDYCPICFTCYILNEKVVVLVVSETNTLLIYQETSLKWSAQLQFLPVSIRRTFLRNIYGVIVLLSEEGELQCCYLGTEPSLFVAPPLASKDIDFEKAEEELINLNNVIKNYYNDDAAAPAANPDDGELTLSIEVDGQLTPCPHASNVQSALNNQMCTVSVTVQPRGRVLEAQVAVHVQRPLRAVPAVHHRADVSERTVLTCGVFPDETADVATLRVRVVASYVTAAGAPRVASRMAALPLALVLEACPPAKEARHKLTLSLDQSLLPLATLFPEFMDDHPQATGNAIGFKNVTDAGQVVTVLVAKSSERYRLQSDSLASLNVMVEQIVSRLNMHFGDASDYLLEYTATLPVNETLEYVNAHFEARQRVKFLQNELFQHSSQFRLIQKRLISKFKVKNPTPLGNLEILLDDTYAEILKVCSNLENAMDSLVNSQIELSCVLNLLVNLMRLMHVPEKMVDVMESALCSNVNDIEGQNWEDVLDASLCFLLRTVLATSEKEKLRAAHTSFEEIKEILKVEKHLARVLEKVSDKESSVGDNLQIIEEKREPPAEPGEREIVPIGSKFGESSSRLLSARKNLLRKRARLEDMRDTGET